MTFRVEHELATALAGALQTLEGVTGCATCEACRGAAELRARAIRASLSMESAAALAGCIPGANASLDRLNAERRAAQRDIDACIELDRVAGGARLEC